MFYGDGGTFRCSTHPLNFPARSEFKTCPICGQETYFLANASPDPEWAEKAAVLIEEHSEEESEGTPEGVHQLKDTPVQMREFRYFIDSRDVIRSGVWHRLNPDDVVRIGHQLFEVLGYSYTRREYLIEPLGLTEEGLARLLGE